MRILKYGVSLGENYVRTALGSVILSTRFQYNSPMSNEGENKIWLLYPEKEEQYETLKIVVLFTGQELPNAEKYRFLGTNVNDRSGLVYHIFLRTVP